MQNETTIPASKAGYRNSRWFRVACPALVATVLAFALGQIRPLAKIEQWTEDLRMIYGPHPAEADPNIVLVTITDQLLDSFRYRSPVDRQFLAMLLQQIAAKHPRAVGLDVLLDTPTEPAKDDMLRQVMRHYPVPLLSSFIDDPREIPSSNLAFLRDFVPPDNRAMANVPTDDDGIVRHIYDGHLAADGQYIPGLARGILQRLGVATPEARPELYYRPDPGNGTRIFPRIPANLVPEMPDALFQGKIVLIGADLALADRHLTPFVLSKGAIDVSMPGIVIHAHGLSQLLEHLGVRHLPLAGAMALTLLLSTLDGLLRYSSLPVWLRFFGTFILIGAYGLATFVIYLATLVVLPIMAPVMAIYLAHDLSSLVSISSERGERRSE